MCREGTPVPTHGDVQNCRCGRPTANGDGRADGVNCDSTVWSRGNGGLRHGRPMKKRARPLPPQADCARVRCRAVVFPTWRSKGPGARGKHTLPGRCGGREVCRERGLHPRVRAESKFAPGACAFAYRVRAWVRRLTHGRGTRWRAGLDWRRNFNRHGPRGKRGRVPETWFPSGPGDSCPPVEWVKVGCDKKEHEANEEEKREEVDE